MGLLTWLYRFDPDPHHDGYMFTAARGVSEGLELHRQVFYQYGPLTGWLHGLVLFLFGSRLFVLRLVSVASIVGALYFAQRSAQHSFSKATASIGTVLYLASAYFFSESLPPLAWSSDVALLLQGIVLFIVARGISSYKKTNKAFVLIGAVLALLCLTRLSTGLVSSSFVFAVLFLDKGRRKNVLNLLTGWFSVALGAVVILWAQGSLSLWWTQTIVIPRHIYLRTLGGSGVDSLGVSLASRGIPLLAICTAVVLLAIYSSRVSSVGNRLLVQVLGAMNVALFFWLVGRSTDYFLIGRDSILWIVVVMMVIIITPSEIATYAENRDLPRLLFIAMSLASLVQIFPITDYRHLWWAVFPAIYPATELLLKFLANSNFGKILIGGLVGLTVIAGIHGLMATLSIPRYKLPGETFDGMLARRDVFLTLDDNLRLKSDFEQSYGSRPSLNLCVDGLYAGLSGKVGFPDPYFVDGWEFPTQVHDEAKQQEFVRKYQPFVWMCPPVVQPSVDESAPTALSVIQPFGYRLTARRKCLVDDPRFNEWPRLVYLAVPSNWPQSEIEAQLKDDTECMESM